MRSRKNNFEVSNLLLLEELEKEEGERMKMGLEESGNEGGAGGERIIKGEKWGKGGKGEMGGVGE